MVTINITGGTVNLNCYDGGDATKEALKMANDALVKLQAAADKLDNSVNEVAKEVADIKSSLGNSAEDQAAISALADRVAAAAAKLSDINPETPGQPPVEEPTTGEPTTGEPTA